MAGVHSNPVLSLLVDPQPIHPSQHTSCFRSSSSSSSSSISPCFALQFSGIFKFTNLRQRNPVPSARGHFTRSSTHCSRLTSEFARTRAQPTHAQPVLGFLAYISWSLGHPQLRQSQTQAKKYHRGVAVHLLLIDQGGFPNQSGGVWIEYVYEFVGLSVFFS